MYGRSGDGAADVEGGRLGGSDGGVATGSGWRLEKENEKVGLLENLVIFT